MTLKPRVSYLLPGALDWVIDSGETPYLIVYARHKGTILPGEHVQEDGTIVLNLAGTAIRNLQFGSGDLSFHSRFSGVSQFIRIPYRAVIGMIGKESGQGIYFPENHPKVGESRVTETRDQVEEGHKNQMSKDGIVGPSHLKLVD